jgi:hypothetical protein
VEPSQAEAIVAIETTTPKQPDDLRLKILESFKTFDSHGKTATG